METTQDRPKPNFVIRLAGNDVKPWRVPTRVLGRLLAAVQRLLDQRDDLADVTDEGVGLQAPNVASRSLQLIKIQNASAGYAVASSDSESALSLLIKTGHDLEKPDAVEWAPSAISSLDELSQLARQLGVVIELRKYESERQLGQILASVDRETAITVKRHSFEVGYASVLGRLEGVGGVTETRCRIHIPKRTRLLYCDIASDDLTRQLGKHLYEDVVLTGEAIWYRSNQQVKSLKVTSFDPAKTDSFAEIAREVREAGGRAWDAIADPDSYIREMRE